MRAIATVANIIRARIIIIAIHIMLANTCLANVNRAAVSIILARSSVNVGMHAVACRTKVRRTFDKIIRAWNIS